MMQLLEAKHTNINESLEGRHTDSLQHTTVLRSSTKDVLVYIMLHISTRLPCC